MTTPTRVTEEELAKWEALANAVKASVGYSQFCDATQDLHASLTVDAILRLIASHHALEKRVAWQPIETAPKDGTHILVINARNQNPLPATVHWFDGAWSLSVNQMAEYSDYVWGPPTHWMLCPQPPAALSRQEG